MQSFLRDGIYANRDSMFQMDIEQLIERGRQGDEAALGSLYRAYHQRMTGICRRIVGNSSVAEELAHDAFLLAFAKLGQLHQPKRFEAWLTSITTNVARRYVQRHHRPATLSLSNLSDSACKELSQEPVPADDGPLPTMTELMAAVDALPNGYSQVFKLAVVQELSHKEIAEILGIAAHSSSSQLARAKKMLQKSLAHYWSLWLLPLVLPLAVYLYKVIRPDVRQPLVTKHEPAEPGTVHDDEVPSATERSEETPAIEHVATSTPILAPNDTVLLSNEEKEQTDTVVIPLGGNSLPDIRSDQDAHIAGLPSERQEEEKAGRQKWSVDLAYAGSMGEQSANRPFVFTGKEMTEAPSDATSDVVPSVRSFDTWSDYAEALQSGVLDVDFKTYKTLLKMAQNNAALSGSAKIERRTHHYMPVTVSLALKYKLDSRFGLETGLSYSRLKSETEIGTGGNAIREQQTIHYLGIPLKGTYNIFNVGRWSIYSSLGAKLEIPVYAPFSTGYYVNGIVELDSKSTLHAPLQWSFSVGAGLQYHLTPRVGFFAEPGLQYYIPTGSDIETYRTEHPFTFSLPIGIRITW